MFRQRIQVNFSPPAYRPPPAPDVAWSEVTALLALTVGIADVVPVHSSETPICAYAAMGSWPI